MYQGRRVTSGLILYPWLWWLKKKEKMHKTWYNTLYATLLEDRIKMEKSEKLLYAYVINP